MDTADHDQEAFDKISEEFAAAIRLGKKPSIDDWVATHKDRDGQLRQLLTSVAMIEGLKDSSSSNSRHESESFSFATPTQLDEYQIIGEIGRGGMGIVYEAIHQSLGRRVAIKVLASRMLGDEKNLTRFRREARAAARLRHSNIVPVYGVGQADGLHYYVMDFVKGQSLREWVQSASDDSAITKRASTRKLESSRDVDTSHENPASDSTEWKHHDLVSNQSTDSHFRWVANIGSTVCDALQYAHDQGVLHRDIKPANLLLDQQDVVWIADFGLAKLHDPNEMTETGDIVGTPQYMSPECFEGKFDAQSEIYSVALTLFELLTRHPAIDGKNPAEIVRRSTTGEVISPRKHDPSIPRDFETILMKALSVDPQSRYASAGQMRDDLNRFMRNEPIAARPIGYLERTGRWIRREPLAAGLTLATFASLVTMLSVAAVAYIKTASALGVAETSQRSAEQSLVERTAALSLAKQQRLRAETNLQVAVQAFDQIMQNVAGRGVELDAEYLGELADSTSPTVSAADAELLQTLLGFFDELAAKNDEDLRSVSADAYRRVGDIYQRLGKLQEADTAYARSLVLYDALAQQQPQSISLIVTQAEILNEQAVIAALRGQRLRCGRLYRVTTDRLGDSELAMQSADGRFQLARAQMIFTSINSLSGLDGGGRRPPGRGPEGRLPIHRPGGPPPLRGGETADAATEAIETLKTLVDEFPDHLEYQLTLSRAYRNASKIASRHRRPAGARMSFRQSINMLDDILQKEPHSERIRYELAKTLASSEVGGVDNLVHATRANRVCDGLLDQNPDVIRYQALKAHILGKMAGLHRRMGNEQLAVKTLTSQLSIERELTKIAPGVPAYRISLSQTLEALSAMNAKNGDPTTAVANLNEAIMHLEQTTTRNKNASGVARPHLERLRTKLDDLRERS